VQEGAAFWQGLLAVRGDRGKTDEPKLKYIHNPAAVFQTDNHTICTMREGDNHGL
jgi:hypothetical protein